MMLRAILPGRSCAWSRTRMSRRAAVALKQPMPDMDRVTSLVSGIMDEYNKIVTQVTREARGR